MAALCPSRPRSSFAADPAAETLCDWLTSGDPQPPATPAQAACRASTQSVGGPIPAASRTGRDNQRYTEDGARLVAG